MEVDLHGEYQYLALVKVERAQPLVENEELFDKQMINKQKGEQKGEQKCEQRRG